MDALGTLRIREVIAGLLRENAFVTKDELGIYRFHPLFKDYLADCCPDDEEQKNVCRRAGRWALAHACDLWLNALTLFERAGSIEEYLSRLNYPGARRINYSDIGAVCRIAAVLPPEKCLAYPFPYLQLIIGMLLSGQRQATTLAGRLIIMMQKYFTSNKSENGNVISGELCVLQRVTEFGDCDRGGDNDPLLENAAILLGGRPSEIINPADPFTFGLPMLLHSEYMRPGTLDEVVARGQYNAYELVSNGFGRGSETLLRAEAALLRCEFDNAKLLARQAALDAAQKNQYFIMASAYFTLMRRALFLGDTVQASGHLAELRELIPVAIRTLPPERLTIAMLREVLVLSECFYYTALRKKNDIASDLLDGTHPGTMATVFGVPYMLSARAMLMTGDCSGALRICDNLSRLPNPGQSARLYRLILTALCRAGLGDADGGFTPLIAALTDGAKDGIVLPFAENPDILPLLKRCEHNGIPAGYFTKIRRQCEAYRNVMPAERTESIPRLSEREREVLRLIAAGKSRKEAAMELLVQEETVKKHLAVVYKKLGVRNRTEAVALARSLEML